MVHETASETTDASQTQGPGWSRRQFLGAGGLTPGVLGAGGLLSACTGSSTGSSMTAVSTTPKRGVTLRVGSNGGGTTDTLRSADLGAGARVLRVRQLYDPLVWVNNQGRPQLTLAKSITSDSDGTQWTVEIHDGIKTDASKAFTSEDVLFSLRRSASNKFPGASVLGPVDLAAFKTIDRTRLLLVYRRPFGALIEALSFLFFYMMPRGFDPKRPDRTGPFKFVSFTPGAQRHMMQHGGGRIVLFASVSALQSEPDVAHYNAAKAGMESLTHSMARELGRYDLVNAVGPGWVRTKMSEEAIDQPAPGAFARINAVGRWGEPEEVADRVRYLATDAPAFLNGQHILVDDSQTSMAPMP